MPNDDVMPLVVALRADWATLAVSAAECSDWSPLSSCSSVGAWLSIFWKKKSVYVSSSSRGGWWCSVMWFFRNALNWSTLRPK